MNSEWFLFKGTHHIGPFTSVEIIKMYECGDINKSVLIWKEGEKGWEPLFKVSNFKNLFKTDADVEVIELPSIPEIPGTKKNKKLPAPIKTNLREIEKEKTQTNIKLELKLNDELPPPLPIDVLMEFEQKKFVGVKQVDYTKYVLYSLGFLAILLISRQFFLSKNEVQFKIRNIMPSYLEKLEATAVNPTHKPLITFALTLDGQKLYVASNLERELDISVKLTSVPDRILGNTNGVMYLRSKIYDHLGEFDKVYLTNGQSFSPGEYDYEAHLVEKHFINTYFPTFSVFSFFKKLNKKITLKGRELIFAGSSRDFESRMLKTQEESKKLKIKPIQDLILRLETILGLVNQLNEKFESILKNSKTVNDVKVFEAYYIKEISPLMQNLVIANEINGAEFNIIIKEFSESVLDLITMTNKSKKMNKSDKQKISIIQLRNAEQIRMHIEKYKTKLEEQVKLISN